MTVFNFNGSYWIENQRLNSPTPQKNDYFGSSVAISHDTVIVGAYG
ncbi:FG-GAP repeat protein [Vibrio vulnificus]|nr:FG-GAP repeat protein [Vibrio vulnificus]HDY7489085.1 FG-GAP repeat protein [Vibrio vulnificus]HDY7951960.1 FG-GAP repeat protein [Vibrio vulnificus]HDY8192487.1 FG-GAP repeat protein [Vibrio vulnificus]